MQDKILPLLVAVVSVCFIKYWMEKRRKERGIPIFKVKKVWNPAISQKILRTGASFQSSRGEQDWLLIKKYYRGRGVTADNSKYKVDRIKKIPACNWNGTYLYCIYFQEYLNKEFPCRITVHGHIRYKMCICKETEIMFYDHMGEEKCIKYRKLLLGVFKKKIVLYVLPSGKRLTVFYSYNFRLNEFSQLQEILVKYAWIGRKNS